MPGLMGKAAFERLGRVLDYLSDAHRQGLPAEHWYLMIVGVLPDQRGRGHGQALLAPIMTRADAAGRRFVSTPPSPRSSRSTRSSASDPRSRRSIRGAACSSGPIAAIQLD